MLRRSHRKFSEPFCESETENQATLSESTNGCYNFPAKILAGQLLQPFLFGLLAREGRTNSS